MDRRVLWLACALAVGLAAGCDDGDQGSADVTVEHPADAGPDVELDMAPLDGTLADASPDTAPDVAPDAAPDVGPSWLADIEGDLPSSLSAVGVYDDLALLAASPSMIEYVPASPLWSSGAAKHRLLYLPEGERIDASDAAAWRFPVGTVLVKTFGYDDLKGRQGHVPLETRLMFKRAARWDYAVYQWDDDGGDATLLTGNWVEVPLDPTGPDGQALRHTIPARLDCRTCHETSEAISGTPVLGIDAFQFDPVLADVTDGADAPRNIEGRFPAETAALRYFVGNCNSCHHGGRGPNASFSLFPDAAVENTVNVPTVAEGTVDGIRVTPGDVALSELYNSAVHGRDPGNESGFKPMPPLGIDRTDPGVEPLLRAWIEGMN